MKTAIAIMALLTSLNLGATSLADQCANRIKVLDELGRILQKRHYAFRKKASVQETKSQLSLSYENYKKLIINLKQQHREGIGALAVDNDQLHKTHIVACLLRSGELLQMLKQVAKSGGKELDYFSKTWRSSFPNYAK